MHYHSYILLPLFLRFCGFRYKVYALYRYCTQILFYVKSKTIWTLIRFPNLTPPPWLLGAIHSIPRPRSVYVPEGPFSDQEDSLTYSSSPFVYIVRELSAPSLDFLLLLRRRHTTYNQSVVGFRITFHTIIPVLPVARNHHGPRLPLLRWAPIRPPKQSPKKKYPHTTHCTVSVICNDICLYHCLPQQDHAMAI